ncbi:ABC transporter ATP-binding protein [Candidatus Woesearchaeota archaeon]|nr:ABC transporter ATP-binding protein [Candidatus Woesearchaeota archaeon]MCF7901122.1 ABC transporter ATP-binding protein [Candidatus Woesearchaeota archaeon]MCF8012889.1 ABC transporter ATP-binding protein [Candidatus Woesearchaeota archaeon]
MSNIILEIKNLNKHFKSKEVLKDINFKIPKASIVGITGPSGCGKTTLLNCIAGIIHHDSGNIIFEDSEVDSDTMKKNMGFSFQRNSFYFDLTIRENMYFFGTQLGLSVLEVHERTDKLIELVQLTESMDVIAKKLSGDMQKRLDLALALLEEPKVIFLDEPFNGLDESVRKQIWELIINLSKKHITILIISHFLEELEENANYFIEINSKGKNSEGFELFKEGQWCLEIIFNKVLKYTVKEKKIVSNKFSSHYDTKTQAINAFKKFSSNDYSKFIKKVEMFQKKSKNK